MEVIFRTIKRWYINRIRKKGLYVLKDGDRKGNKKDEVVVLEEDASAKLTHL
jgi:hypothetical protein